MDKSSVVAGTCLGTGAAINVCLGFIPSKVEVWNVADAGSKLPKCEWIRNMKRVSALDNGVLETGLDDTDYDRTVLTSAGISEYAGGDDLFYDRASSRWEDASGGGGNAVEEVYVDGSYDQEHASNPAYRCIGDPIAGKPGYNSSNELLGGGEPPQNTKVQATKGFTIGTNANLNADGEALVWCVWR